MKKLQFLLFFVFLTVATFGMADTRYVAGPKDTVLRTGPSEYADPSGKLVKDSQVNVIGVDRSTDYALVVTPDKKRGWLPASTLTSTAPSVPVLSQPESSPIQDTTASTDPTGATVSNSNQGTQSAIVTSSPVSTNTTDPKKPYYGDVAEKLNALASANAATPNSIVKLSPQEMLSYTAIQRENRAWFISGAGILILGMFIGLVISKIAFRRRRSSWD